MGSVIDGAFGLIIAVAVMAIVIDAWRGRARQRHADEAARLIRRDCVEKDLLQRIRAAREKP